MTSVIFSSPEYKGKPCTLSEYPLKIENGEVLIDTDGVTPNFVN
jgi:toluene monooxygenase system ferredoxin subunit